MQLDPHPLLDLVAFETTWPAPLGGLSTPEAWRALAAPGAAPAFPAPEAAEVEAVRALLRHGGFKPAGRSKPCSEYIRKAVADDRFPWINPAVDATNLAVLHGALPISTVDPDRLREPLRVGLAGPGASYVFNASGQEIDLSGLLCLHDADGPCANAVKDAQRAKTTPESTRTLTLVWGTLAIPGRARAIGGWMADRLRELGASVRPVIG